MGSIGKTKAVFFDLGGTLVDPVLHPNGTFARFKAIPGVIEDLGALKTAGIRLGVISNIGDVPPAAVRAALTTVGLLDLFEAELVLLSSEVKLDKTTEAIFRLATERAALDPTLVAYVGDDPIERRTARSGKLRTAASPAVFLLARASDRAGPDLSRIRECVTDAENAGLDPSPGPDEPDDFADLVGRLEIAKEHLPPLYRRDVAEPFVAELQRIGLVGFEQIKARDPGRKQDALLMFDVAQSILQNGEGVEELATDAFEEVVSDLYDGFLSAQDRAGVKVPDRRILAPLVKWGNPDFGPYTWPINATSVLGVDAGVVSLPPGNARQGLFAWSALGHETAGHDILNADDGLAREISRKVLLAIKAANLGNLLAEYWSARIDETASDVMGILNMGPAAGIGLVVYFRGLNGAGTGKQKLRNRGPASDPHPADILRGYLAAATVRLLAFDEASDWAAAIDAETDADFTGIELAGVAVTQERARRSCEIVAKTIATQPMVALNDHALIDIQDWRNEDEAIVAELAKSLVTNTPLQVGRETGIFAAHLVAAACLAALGGQASIKNVFVRMLSNLKKMHDANAAWGPLFVAHPGTITRDFVYLREA